MNRYFATIIVIAVPLGVLSSCSPAPVKPSELAPAAQVVLTPAGETVAFGDKAVALVDHLTKGEFAAVVAEFDAQFAARGLTESALAANMADFKRRAGEFKQQAGVKVTREADLDVAYVTCLFERTTLIAKVMFNQQGQIAGLSFRQG